MQDLALKDKVFLLKIPPIIYNKLQSQKELGYIDIIPYNSKNMKYPKIQLHLNDKFPAQNFTVNYNPTDYFFTFKEKKGKLSKVKKIDYFGSCIARDDKTSDDIFKELNKEHEKSIYTKRVTGRIQDDEDEKIKRRKKEDIIRNKKTRKEKDVLTKEIFNMFSKQTYLTIKQISEQLQQPDNYLKEILNPICDYFSSGINKGCYKLKSAYVSSMDNEENI